MRAILHANTWRRGPKPPAGVSVLQGHPLAWGLSGLWLFNESGGRPRNLITNRHGPGTLTNWRWAAGGFTKGGTSFGTPVDDQVFGLENDTIVIPLQNCTIVVGYYKHLAAARNSSAFGVASGTLSARSGVSLPFGDGTVYWDFGGATAGTTRLSVAGLTVTNNLWVFSTGPRGMEIWQDGVLRASNSANPTRTAGNVNFCLGINGQTEGTGGQSDQSDYWLLATYKRQLTKSEIAEVSINPYVMVSQPVVSYSIRAITSVGGGSDKKNKEKKGGGIGGGVGGGQTHPKSKILEVLDIKREYLKMGYFGNTTVSRVTGEAQTATLLTSANGRRVSVEIQNNGASNLWVGTTTSITSANGIKIAAGESYYDPHSRAAWYGYSESGNASVGVIETTF